jgi:hypothetical protein
MAGSAIEGENIFDRAKVSQTVTIHFKADFLHQLAADGFFAVFAKLNPTAKRAVKVLVLDRIVSFCHENAVVMEKYTNGKRADLIHSDSK